jgi:hypothetical protein
MKQAIAVLWPSFLMAGLATVVFFAAVDPLDLVRDPAGPARELRLHAYSIGFFLFWLLTAASCLLTCYFQRTPGR